jgi:hypothetical protein
LLLPGFQLLVRRRARLAKNGQVMFQSFFYFSVFAGTIAELAEIPGRVIPTFAQAGF